MFCKFFKVKRTNSTRSKQTIWSRPRRRAEEAMHRACGAFLCGVRTVQSQVPEDFMLREKDTLYKSFMSKHSDAELQLALESSCPPLKVETISMFRSLLFRYKRQVGFALFYTSRTCFFQRCFLVDVGGDWVFPMNRTVGYQTV